MINTQSLHLMGDSGLLVGTRLKRTLPLAVSGRGVAPARVGSESVQNDESAPPLRLFGERRSPETKTKIRAQNSYDNTPSTLSASDQLCVRFQLHEISKAVYWVTSPYGRR